MFLDVQAVEQGSREIAQFRRAMADTDLDVGIHAPLDDISTIKAMTMYKMVEDVSENQDGSRKLLFLTAKQAMLIARRPASGCD